MCDIRLPLVSADTEIAAALSTMERLDVSGIVVMTDGITYGLPSYAQLRLAAQNGLTTLADALKVNPARLEASSAPGAYFMKPEAVMGFAMVHFDQELSADIYKQTPVPAA